MFLFRNKENYFQITCILNTMSYLELCVCFSGKLIPSKNWGLLSRERISFERRKFFQEFVPFRNWTKMKM